MTDSNSRTMADYQNEREAFEAWAKSVIESDPQQWPLMGGHDGEDYWAYMGWQARAAISISTPELGEQLRRIAEKLPNVADCDGPQAELFRIARWLEKIHQKTLQAYWKSRADELLSVRIDDTRPTTSGKLASDKNRGME